MVNRGVLQQICPCCEILIICEDEKGKKKYVEDVDNKIEIDVGNDLNKDMIEFKK